MEKIHVADDSVLIGYLKSLLEAEGIASIVRNDLLRGAIGELPANECWPELWVTLALCSDRSFVGCSPHCNRVMCLWWASVHDVRVCRGRFCDVSLRLRSM